MIEFKNNSNEIPYSILRNKYELAKSKNQNSIEAISIASYCKKNRIVDSRYVNLKIIDNKDFIFLSNYESPKGLQFQSHDQISVLIYWNSINLQIRMKAKIKKTSLKYNKLYFLKRSKEKNALAISSEQSKKISSYKNIKDNYFYVRKNADLKKCPKYWGGYSFIPYEFEFWEGNKYRLNKRDLYSLEKRKWIHSVLQP